MGYELDRNLFAELSGMDPSEVCRRALCRRDQGRGSFEIEVWGYLYDVFCDTREIMPREASSPPVNPAMGLAIMHYLLRAREAPLRGEWISEKDLPGGEQFFRGPHAIPGDKIAKAFGDDIGGFRSRREELGGEAMDMGDAAFRFRYLPRVPVAAVLWGADEEFGADARLLFDRTLGEHLPLDVIFGIAVDVCARISAGKDKAP